MTALTAAREDYLASLGADHSPTTIRTYRSGLRAFWQFLPDHGLAEKTDAKAVKEDILRAYHAWLIQQHGSEARGTIRTYYSAVCNFMHYCSRNHLFAKGITYDGMVEQSGVRRGVNLVRTPQIDERLPFVVLFAKLLDEDPSYLPITAARDKAVILTLFSTGMRRTEVANLNKKQVERSWTGEAIIRGKGDKDRTAFFSPEARAALRAYFELRNDTYEPAFLRHDQQAPLLRVRGAGETLRLSDRGIYRIVKKIAGLAGLPLTKPHDFRHAKATVMLNQGAKLSEVQDILGHASPETTKRIYAHYETQHLRDAFDRFSMSAEDMAARLTREA